MKNTKPRACTHDDLIVFSEIHEGKVYCGVCEKYFGLEEWSPDKPKLTSKAKIQKWEYSTSEIVESIFFEHKEHDLNLMGEDGWELVSAFTSDGAVNLLYKRPSY